jgi:hypothetical protein
MRMHLMLASAAVVMLEACAPAAAPQPWWMKKMLNQPNVLEGKGYAVGLKDKKALRDTAYNDALQKLILASETNVSGYIETRLYSERGLGDAGRKATGGELLDNVNKTIYDTVLQRKFFEEYFDPRSGEYWVYCYIPASAVNRIAAEKSLETINKAAQKSERMKAVREDLEADLEEYKQREARELEAIRSSMQQ